MPKYCENIFEGLVLLTFCKNKILAQFLTLNLSQMLFSRLMGGTFQNVTVCIHPTPCEGHPIDFLFSMLSFLKCFVWKANNITGQIVGKNMGIAESSIKSVHCFCSKDPHPLLCPSRLYHHQTLSSALPVSIYNHHHSPPSPEKKLLSFIHQIISMKVFQNWIKIKNSNNILIMVHFTLVVQSRESWCNSTTRRS